MHLFYNLLKKYTQLALPFYFNRWQISGAGNIPNGPVIFVPNHQNAFLDAILVTCSSDKNPWHVTRSDVFKKKWISGLLKNLKMLPVFRFRDGFGTLRNNNALFENYISLLNSGESLLVFAEGNHGTKYQLRPFQKGVVRIALGVKPEINLHLVPVGIQYDSHNEFQTDVLVNFGPPVAVNSISNKSNSIKQAGDFLLDDLHKSLKQLMLHIDEPDYDAKLIYLKLYSSGPDDLVERLHNHRQCLKFYPDPPPARSNIHQKTWLQFVLMKYTRLNLAVTHLVIQRLILSRIPDPQFIPSVKFSAGMFLAPLILTIQSLLVLFTFKSAVLGILYFVSVPGSILILKKLR